MNTLFIHGLFSSPNESKIKLLESFDFKPFAEHIDYEQTPGAYHLLKGIVQNENIEFIVGSSLGGYLGFWLAEELKLPCLLFNPAIIYANKPALIIPEFAIGGCPLRMIVQGKLDKIVDPEANQQFLKKNLSPNQDQKIILFDWLEHTIDLVTFEISIHWAKETLIKNKFKTQQLC